jgi:hypothetical protein
MSHHLVQNESDFEFNPPLEGRVEHTYLAHSPSDSGIGTNIFNPTSKEKIHDLVNLIFSPDAR